ncbi:hypothetical protein GZH47_02585 [Paenibacillus rhizovicinus]|uniref:Uncharacterized protein n=1 Tax=Paenibacillus rhizovicinus TaxID=2704463 RepID=A0A6C0NUD4_9BACL|nr:hypothetical protein [Paenibacillus rhizovicinus]QHW29829.1 hypothetical protein GZH47_02585 [Paenibacillus rhizovicinus]
MLVYRYDSSRIEIQETNNGDDIEFHIQVKDTETFLPRVKSVRAFFDEDDVYTDVLFYAYPDQRYSVIVKPQYYTDFILQLMKQHVLLQVEWTAD